MPENSKVIPVRVAVRCRPIIAKEKDEGCQQCIQFVPKEPQLVLGKNKAFTYDYVFSTDDLQKDVYDDCCKPLVDNIFKGYNATVLAYGQTGSGKTFTMGGCHEGSLSDVDQMGVMPRVLKDLFSGIEAKDDYEFTVKVSYIEIYNEELIDLLCPPSKRDSLNIRENVEGGIKIQGLREVQVTSYSETIRCLELGSQGRTTGATAMNNTSSRSHAIFTIHVEQKKKEDMDDSCEAKFHLVDLAGSERAKRTQAEGERFKEGVNINMGLLALGNVISALGEDAQKGRHIPYRDAKLTRLLQDSLGGNSHTLMIACISPADSNMEETLNTLRYADRARKIKNKPIVNRDPQAAEIMRLKQLVQQLQEQLIHRGGGFVTMTSLSSNSDSEDMLSLQDKNRVLEEENTKLTRELQKTVDQSTALCENLIRLEMKCDRMKARLEDLKKDTCVDLDALSCSLDTENNPQLKEQIQKLKSFAEKVTAEISDENLSVICEEEQYQDEEQFDEEGLVSETPDSRAMSKQFTLRQLQMNHELLELNKLLAKKEELANQMTQNDDKMEAIKGQYETTMKQLENEISSLSREKEDLNHALHEARSNTAATKISEQRRKRLQELEQQIGQLKKKMTEQSKMLRLKEQSDKHVSKLNMEIQGMKQQRVKLMKQMKEDSDSFRRWKQQKDKEIVQLMQKDRKRQFEIAKMRKQNEKQTTVLKRKAEEAAAANKRLKEALSKQKVVLAERNGKLEQYDATSIGNRVRKWLSHELDVRVGIREAKYHLDSLLNDRKFLSEQLKQLKDKFDDSLPCKKMACEVAGRKSELSFEEEETRLQIKSLEQEVDLRNAQITDLQQKIMDADQDSKGKSIWESLHTMVESKCALKWLMEQAVSTKADHSITRSKLKDSEENTKDTSHVVDKMEREIETLKKQNEAKRLSLQTKHEDKVLFLLRQLKNDEKNTSLDEEAKERMKFQQEEIERLSHLHEQLQQVSEENEGLKKQLTRAMYQGKAFALMPSLTEPGSSPFLTPTPKPKLKLTATHKNRTTLTPKEGEEPMTYEEYLDEWDSAEEIEEDDSDSEWERTPRVVKKKRFAKKQSSEFNVSQIKCTCKKDCGTKKCGCKKEGAKCGDHCACSPSICENREDQTPQSTTRDSDDDSSEVMNSTFCIDDKDGSSVTPTSTANQTTNTFRTRKVLKMIEKNCNSSGEFEKPKSKLRTLNKSDTTILGGGLKRKRTLLKTGSFFEPL